MFKVDVNGLTQQYRTKPTMNVDITGSSTSIPKPLTYDYMPEGYPKKDGWSIEWDGSIDGKTSAIGAPLYKFSDRVMTYEEFLSANYVAYVGGEQHPGMASEDNPMQNQLSDAVSIFKSIHISFFVVSEDNAEADAMIFPEKGLYANEKMAPPFKMFKETITPMYTDFLPKNLNVVFTSKSGTNTPTNCNVTYDELRGWVERGVPVFPVFIYTANSQYVIHNITEITLLTDMLGFVYYISGSSGSISRAFAYKSDGTIEILSN